MGGLARKATIIKQIIDEGNEVIVADAGNLFFKKDKISPGVTTEIAKVSAETIVKCFNKMGCDAYSVGSHDFAAGIDFIKYLKSLSNFPFISANIFDRNGQKLFEPYVIVNKVGKRIGFIGLSSVFKNDDLSIKDPFRTLRNIIDEIEDQTDMIILLFNGTETDLTNLRSKSYQIDLVVRSRSNLHPPMSKDGGGSSCPIYSLGERGKYLFEFEIIINDDSDEFIDLPYYKSKKDRAANYLKNYNIGEKAETVDLESEFGDNPTVLRNIKKYIKEKEKIERKLNNSANSIDVKKYALDKEIKDRNDIIKIINQGKEKINKLQGPNLNDE